MYGLKSEFRKRKSKVSRKRKSKFQINLKPKILKPNEINPNEINPMEFKNKLEIDQLYETIPEQELAELVLPKLRPKEENLKRELNIKDSDIIKEPYKKPTIVLIDKSPKGYIKQYKIDIISEYIKTQIIKIEIL